MGSTVQDMIGHFIQPWPGESLLGEVIAVSGEDLVCSAKGGLHFTVKLADVVAGLHIDHGRAFNGSLVRYRITAAARNGFSREAVTKRDWPVSAS